MKNVKLKFNDTWAGIYDGWLCIGDSENQIFLKPEYFNKLLAAINYTRCCTELKSKECPMCNEAKDCEGHTVCEDCGGRSF